MSKDKNSTVTAIVDENPHIESNSRNQSNPTINNAPSEMKEYISGTIELYGTLMLFLNNSDSNEYYFQDLINIICQQRHAENCEQFEEFLQLIVNVSTNIHREESFSEKNFKFLNILKFKSNRPFQIKKYSIYFKVSIGTD
ncbi:hypothetical protein M9Y10_043438 [Tritrichomonas musculus]|uniref:Uncharacterized protein n=1 Tax=Tritrichomonas musculus TaxID=1915356 RepID=A0ABR2K2L0_9EUKA